MKGFDLTYALTLLILTAVSCSIETDKIHIEFPIKKEASELCEYYSWVNFFHNGDLIKKDSTVTTYYNIPNQADSVEVYANGYGFTLIDTSFKLSNCSVKLEVAPNSSPYFLAHSQVDKDVQNGQLTLYTEDYEIFVIDSIYQWLDTYGASVKYYSWKEPGRNQRFVYNCYATKFLYGTAPNGSDNTPQILDSLIYLEMDQYCGKPVGIAELPILQKLGKINDQIILHVQEKLKHNQGYKEEIMEKDYRLNQIMDSLLISPNYYYVRLAEVYGYFYPYKMIESLIPLLTDTTFVGLTNSADLIINDRILNGDLQFYGHGGGVEDDLFIVSGRANHLLSEITGSSFGQVRMNPNYHFLEKLQCRWRTYKILISKIDLTTQ